jgi:hypothetical protein
MVWTPIPRSMGRWIADRLTGPIGDVIWFLFISALVLAVAYLLITISPVFGGIIAGTIVGLLVSDQLQAWLRDAYKRRFYRPW